MCHIFIICSQNYFQENTWHKTCFEYIIELPKVFFIRYIVLKVIWKIAMLFLAKLFDKKFNIFSS